jgi:hypothetical protein
MSALHQGAAVAPRATAPGYLASRRPKRSDTLIASAVLLALIAGWVMNFISLKQLPDFGTLLAHATLRHT